MQALVQQTLCICKTEFQAYLALQYKTQFNVFKRQHFGFTLDAAPRGIFAAIGLCHNTSHDRRASEISLIVRVVKFARDTRND